MNKTLTAKPSKRLLLAWTLITLALMLLLVTTAFGTYNVLSQTVTPRVAIRGPEIMRPHLPGASDLASKYLQSFLQHDYHGMWQLLHPQTRSVWPNENAYTSYWQKRFQGYTIAGYTLGAEQMLRTWTNPETMATYKHVIEIPVSLQITPTTATLDDAKGLETVNPDVLHPEKLFHAIPLYLYPTSDGHWQILDGGPVDLEAPILPPLHPTPRQVQVPILMYHHISDTPTTNELDQSLTVPTKLFEQQLQYLQTRHAHSITFNQLFDALYYNGPLPSNPVILTFDDGYTDAYNNAYPLLRKYGFSGMFYIISGKVGWDGQAIWEQLNAMLLGGMQMGSHTVNHVDIGNTYLNSPDEARKELADSRSTLEQHFKLPIQQFCYPSGEPFRNGSLTLRQDIVKLLTSVGYIGSTTDPGETGITQDSQSPQQLLRIRVDGRSDLDTFKANFPW